MSNKHMKPVYWGIFSAGGTVAALIFSILWHGVHRFYYILHDMHVHVGNRTRWGFYGFAIVVFLFVLLIGWF